jgi:hypothetical protein
MSSGIETSFETDCSKCHATNIQTVPKASPAHVDDLSITMTQKTDFAPRGKIIQDNFRRTAFWEIANASEDETTEERQGSSPFHVEWIPR